MSYLNKFSLIGAAALLSISVAAPANAVIIDEFSDPAGPAGQAITSTGGATVSNTLCNLNDVLGGCRTLTVTSTVSSDSVSANLDSSGQLSIGTNGLSPATVSILWDGAGADANNASDTSGTAGTGFNSGAGVDITNGGTLNYLLVEIIALDLVPLNGDITLTDASSNSFTLGFVKATDVNPNAPDNDPPFLHFELLSDFTGIDLAHVTSIQFDFLGTGPYDLILETSLTGNIPEPATVALFGAGLIGLGAVRRRRKAAA